MRVRMKGQMHALHRNDSPEDIYVDCLPTRASWDLGHTMRPRVEDRSRDEECVVCASTSIWSTKYSVQRINRKRIPSTSKEKEASDRFRRGIHVWLPESDGDQPGGRTFLIPALQSLDGGCLHHYRRALVYLSTAFLRIPFDRPTLLNEFGKQPLGSSGELPNPPQQ